MSSRQGGDRDMSGSLSSSRSVKSTLSGSILYIVGKVDQRTIERFEREAKQRNRESWFLAFIMVTSEEERGKGKL